MIINDDENEDGYGGTNIDIPDRTGRQWQVVLFGGPVMRVSDQPRFCDLSLIIIIIMRRRILIIIIIHCMMFNMSHHTWL